MINFTRLETRIMNDEGFSAHPYLDTVGVPTIGYGTTSILGHPVTLDTEIITPENARAILRADIYGALVDVQHLFATLAAMDSVRQEALTNMAYNLGRTRLAGFKNLIAAAADLNYAAMAEAAKDSLWYHQVGQRGPRIVSAIESGVWA